MSRRKTAHTASVLVSMGIGGIAGMRSMTAVALVAGRFAPAPVAWAARVMAMGEMAADKTPFIPDRTDPMALGGRLVVGAGGAAFVASRTGFSPWIAASLGAAAAYASTHIFYNLRRRIGERFAVPDTLLGAAEDAIVVASATRLSDVMDKK